MAGIGSESKMRLALVIEKESEKVLFAEAGKDFVDVLCSFLSKPLVKKMKEGENEYKIMFACKAHHHISDFPGTECPSCRFCMGTELYQIDDGNTSSSSSLAAADTNNSQQIKKLYTCRFLINSRAHCFVSNDREKLCPVCQGYMRTEMKVVYPAAAKTKTTQGMRYVVMDNLEVKPMPMNIMFSAVQLIRMVQEGRYSPKNHIQNMLREFGFYVLGPDDVDLKFVYIGPDKVLELFNAMVQEQELTLTNVILRNNKYPVETAVNAHNSGKSRGVMTLV